jgi:DMSO/TMAO reductase YedYZ heme-binding membrane subunit
MKRNMGSIDRTVRLVLSVVLLVLYLTETVTGTLGLIAILIALLLAVTSFIGFCPLYLPFKFNTFRKR